MVIISPTITEIIYEMERKEIEAQSAHRVRALAEHAARGQEAGPRAWLAGALVRAGMLIDARAGRRVAGAGGGC